MPQMLKVYLVEDEPLARDELKYLLLRTGQVEVCGEAGRMSDALADIKRMAPDIVFLDIHLTQGTGLDLAMELNELDRPPIVVFATAYDEHALKAFELNAFDYILKPFDETRIRQTLEKMSKWLAYRTDGHPVRFPRPMETAVRTEHKGKLAVAANDRILLLETERILSISAEEGRVVIRTQEGEYAMDSTLVEVERKLGLYPFFRAHRAYIVNLDHVTEVQPWFNGTYNLILKDGSKVPVSRTYVKELRSALGF